MYAQPARASSEAEEIIRTADWIELNLVTGEEPSISVAEVTASIAEDPPDTSTTSEHRGEYPDDPEEDDPLTLQHGYWTAAETAAELVFGELRQRSNWFGNRYPIALDGDTASTAAHCDTIQVARFLTLLRSRHLYYRALEDDGVLAGELFEELLALVLRRYVCASEANALRFGVAGGRRGGGLPHSTDGAIDVLAERINEPRGTLNNLADGDLGADTIAWRPFPDQYRGKLTTIGQATISEHQWTKKQPSPKWRSGRLIRFLTQPTTVVAFVESISLTSDSVLDGLGGQFYSLPFDRFRLLCYLRDNDLPSDLHSRIDTWSAGMRDRLLQ